MSKLPSFLVFMGLVAFLAACGNTKTLGPSYLDSTAGANLPDFVVFIYSDLNSNFSQAIPRPSDAAVYYYTGNVENLKNCALAQNQVDSVSGYHSGTATEANCTSLATSLRTEGLFPPQSDLNLTGAGVKISSTGFVYSYFFYNSNSSSGSDVAANAVVPANNRCFKLWGAQVQSGSLVSKGGVAASTVDLKTLKCFGF